ncbi:hypothetical protein prwr041_16400 [Prevotella herbatica]|uniref:IrrE N-terminal-like domain-containing protein n=1 Tax=Prevotella herbatica TaxID=2801997 RepID=A0ABM7NZ00_9BACT|nr:ImmA/IrrE family metallo-endopeptidase [Prevotella herbatica]BCS85747.1 hypothetical protein prwr041_16400 [Prevotella herbatica]
MMKINKCITSLAEEVARNYDSPILLKKIADDELINVIYDDYGKDTFDGLTCFEPFTDEFYIHINCARANSLDNAKGRFTFAHELGHYFIPSHRLGLMSGTMPPHCSVNFLYDNSAWMIEREADAFASSLLMPEYSFLDFIKGVPFDFSLIENIAKYYNVSKSAAALRYSAIGNIPIMVVFGINGKIRWVCRNENFPFWRMKYGNGRGDAIPENTVMGTFFYENNNSDCCQKEIIYAGDCFDINIKEENNQEFFEWCIPYRNMALSVIWENSNMR